MVAKLESLDIINNTYTHPVALSEAQDLRARFQPIGLQAGGEVRAGLNPELGTAQFR